MKASKRKKPEAAGWKVGSAREFLGLSDEETAASVGQNTFRETVGSAE